MEKIEEKYALFLNKVLSRSEKEIKESLKSMNPEDLTALGFDIQNIDEQKIDNIVGRLYLMHIQVLFEAKKINQVVKDEGLDYTETIKSESLVSHKQRNQAIFKATRYPAIWYIVDAMACRNRVLNHPLWTEEKKIEFIEKLIIEEDTNPKKKEK